VKRVIAALAALTVTAACASGAGGQTSDQSNAVRVAHVPSTLFAPLYVADAKGYFADEGIEIELQTIKAGQDAVPLAASGQIDVLVAGLSAGLFNAVHSGLDIKVVGSMGISTGNPDASPTALEVSKDLADSGEITNVADLKGRKIALAGGAGGASAYHVDVILRKAGLTIKDIEPVDIGFPDMEAAISTGGAAGGLGIAPFTTRMEQSGTAVTFAVSPHGTVATGVVYGGEFLENDKAQPFFAALKRAAADLQGDAAKSAEITKILAEATGQKASVLENTPLYEWLPDLAPVPEQLAAMQRTYLDAGVLDHDEAIPTEKFVDTTFAEGASG
jgi:NitT/TauT family transport system substrate-binding protein